MYGNEAIPVVSVAGGNGGNWGNSWEAIIGLAVVGAMFGGFGNGFGGARGSEGLGYELGKMATTNDVANGFAQNTLQRGIDDLLIGQANAINYNNLGFGGIQTAVLTASNNISKEIANCCCTTQRMIEKSTCDILANQNANTQRIIDYMQNEKISALQAENLELKGQISARDQSTYIINALKTTGSTTS